MDDHSAESLDGLRAQIKLISCTVALAAFDNLITNFLLGQESTFSQKTPLRRLGLLCILQGTNYCTEGDLYSEDLKISSACC